MSYTIMFTKSDLPCNQDPYACNTEEYYEEKGFDTREEAEAKMNSILDHHDSWEMDYDLSAHVEEEKE